MEWPKFFRGKQAEVSPENQDILDSLDKLRKAEENLKIVTEESEKASAYSNDYQSGADQPRIDKINKNISEIAEEIMRVCEANNFDPKRFLKPEYIQLVEKARIENQELEKVA